MVKHQEQSNGESSFGWKAGVKEWHVAESEEDWNLIDDLKDLSINENEEEILFSKDICSNTELLEIAKFAELKIWKRNKIYEKVSYTGHECVRVRWVFTIDKYIDGKKKIKARLVARCFEEVNLI